MRGIVAVLCAALVVACVSAATPDKPVISEVFEGRLHFEVEDHRSGDKYIGEGVWAQNQPFGLGLEIFRFEKTSHLEVYRLQRYDMEKQYSLDNVNRSSCQESPLVGAMPSTWEWVESATYAGKMQHKDTDIDIWTLALGFAELTLGVETYSPNTPVFFRRNSSETDFMMYFTEFNTIPSKSLFELPKQCDAAIPAVVEPKQPLLSCRSRSDMLAVANQWWNAHVPYNQGGRYGAYREDCSGFVSACWALPPPGPNTEGLLSYSHQISKGSLQPGDVLLMASEHVVLFGGWTDGSQSHYMAYEETRPGEGTQKRPTPYPYWYSQSSFLPYRANGVC